MTNTALVFALISLLGIAAQLVSAWLRLPAILLLLVAGIVLGPVAGWLDPDALMGDALFAFVSLGVAVILFEGGLTLRLHEIRGHGGVVTRLVTIGVLINWLVIGFATWWLLETAGWQLALLFGALMTVTGPTVVIPLLRSVRPSARTSNVLRWEGILIDPIGALLAVLMFEFIVSGQQQGHALLFYGKALLVGTVIGTLAALIVAVALRRHWLPEYLVNVAVLSLVLAVFTASNVIQYESGLLTVTVMGIVLANTPGVRIGKMLDFKESLSVLLLSLMFILLAARIELDSLLALGVNAWLLLAVVLFIARPLAVGLSSIGSDLSWREQAFIAWIGPRGIVAAAVSALFALKLEGSLAGAELLVPLTFLMITGTVVLQSFTAKPLAKALGLAEPEPSGVLIVGGNRVGLALAEALREQDLRVVIADSDWRHIRDARMAGFETYFGNVSSDHAERHLDLAGIGQVFAVSFQHEFNTLACITFRDELGADKVFSARIGTKEYSNDKHSVGLELAGTPLFAEQVTLDALDQSLREGGELRTTQLTEQFGWADYQAQATATHSEVTPLLIIEDQDRLSVVGELFTLTELDDVKRGKVVTLHHPRQPAPAESSPVSASETAATVTAIPH